MSNQEFDPTNRRAWLVRTGDMGVGRLPDGEYMSKQDFDYLASMYKEALVEQNRLKLAVEVAKALRCE